MNPREVYERISADDSREAACKLRPHEWDLYLRLDGVRTLQEISVACRLDLQWIVSDVERLQQLELVRVVELDLEEYQQRFVRNREATPATAPISAAAPAPTAIPEPAAAEKQVKSTEGTRVSFSLRRGDPAAARPAAPVAPPAPAPLVAAAKPAEEHRLKPLLDFITAHSGGGTVGQLAAYRVFLKVPNDLLRQAGIKSLNLVSEDFVVRDAHLWRVLLNAIEEVLGKHYVPPTTRGMELVAA